MTAPERAWRSAGDHHWGAVITDAGRAAMGIEPNGAPARISEANAEPAPVASAAEALGKQVGQPTTHAGEARPSKAALVLALLRREEGATLAELVEATGWLPHTTRAALTGLRKKGHGIARASATTRPATP